MLGGLNFTYAAVATTTKVLGFMNDFKAIATINLMQFDYSEYTLGGDSVSNARAWIGGLSINAGF